MRGPRVEIVGLWSAVCIGYVFFGRWTAPRIKCLVNCPLFLCAYVLNFTQNFKCEAGRNGDGQDYFKQCAEAIGENFNFDREFSAEGDGEFK